MLNVTVQQSKTDRRFLLRLGFWPLKLQILVNTNAFSDYQDITHSVTFPLRFVYFLGLHISWGAWDGAVVKALRY